MIKTPVEREPDYPKWKQVHCPTCQAMIGESCGKQARGAFHWVRTAPHAARKALSAAKGGA